MQGISSLVELRTERAESVVSGSTRLTPESQVLKLRLPFAGVVWHRPTAVVVERRGQAIQRLPIVDLTLVAQVSLLVSTVLLSAVCLILASRQQES